MSIEISVLLPTRKRPAGLYASVSTCISLADKPEDVEFLYATDNDDSRALDTLKDKVALDVEHHREYRGPRLGYSKMYEYYSFLASKAKGRLLFVWNDDCEMQTKGWDTLLLNAIDPKRPLVQFIRRDTMEHADDTFPIIDRRIYEQLGYISRLHCACDTWLSVVSRDAGVRVFRNDIVFHHHRFNDEVMEEGQAIARAESPRFGSLHKEQAEDSAKIRELLARLEKEVSS